MKSEEFKDAIVKKEWQDDVKIYIWSKKMTNKGDYWDTFQEFPKNKELPEDSSIKIALVPVDVVGTTGQIINKE